MKNKKINEIFIPIFIVLIIIICIILIVIIKRLNNINETENIAQPDTSDCGNIENIKEDIEVVDYFNINTCMNIYLNTLITTNTTNSIQVKQKIYDMLCKKYVTENNVTNQNVLDFVKTYSNTDYEVYTFIPLEISALQKKNISSYLLHGLVNDSSYNVIDDIYAVINFKTVDQIFSIEPIYGEYKSIIEIEINETCNSISSNENNHYYSAIVTYEDIARNYINIYKKLAIGNPNIMYEYLDTKYKNTKFGNVNEFIKYVSDNESTIRDIIIDKFKIEYLTDSIEYICIDTEGRYYIINQNSILDYTIILDTYTIDLPEFLEKYNSTTDQGKVVLNLNKFVLALNDGDYKYAYSKLADGFKINNFPTLDTFETYVKSNFFTKNKFDYKKFGSEGETYYTYQVDITDESETLSNTISKTFIMQLGEGTDFKLSFNK